MVGAVIVVGITTGAGTIGEVGTIMGDGTVAGGEARHRNDLA